MLYNLDMLSYKMRVNLLNLKKSPFAFFLEIFHKVVQNNNNENLGCVCVGGSIKGGTFIIFKAYKQLSC